MNTEAFLNRRADALMKQIGGMSLAEVVGGGDADYGAIRDAARLVDIWFTRHLTHTEHVQVRAVAERLGIDLLAFDQEQAKLEKEKSHV